MALTNYSDEVKKDQLACYAATVDRLHGKLSEIATHHIEMFAALERMTKALREIKATYRN